MVLLFIASKAQRFHLKNISDINKNNALCFRVAYGVEVALEIQIVKEIIDHLKRYFGQLCAS